MERIYFDNAATTQKPQRVIDRIAYFYQHENSNIHRAAHELAARATDAYEHARNVVARFIGAPYSARHAQQTDAIKEFASSIVTVRLKTERGNFTGTLQGTVNFNMATELKNHLQEELHIDVKQYLERHEDGETYRFSSTGGALLALDADQLRDIGLTREQALVEGHRPFWKP